jgi:EAL domain-containing protein (putative c-di-GMP-specific phosphodiesterase class I)
MFTLDNINFHSTIWGDVIVSPHVEKIISPPEECTSVELLCSIKNNNSCISAYHFFQNLTENEHVKLYKLLLTAILNEPLAKNFTISLNTPIQVIRNFDSFLSLLLNNKNQKVAFELLESDIQNISAYEYGVLERLNKLPNVCLWLDDFGNNQSNFDIVLSKMVSFNTIKVSKELFWALFDSDMDFLRSLLTYLSKAHSIIVEGIETKQQLDFISNIKGVKTQGYYFNPQLESINE